MGDAIVNYYPPKYTDAQVEYNATTMRMVSSYNSIPTVTSFGKPYSMFSWQDNSKSHYEYSTTLTLVQLSVIQL